MRASVLAATAALGVLLAGCGSADEAAQAPPPAVVAAEPTPTPSTATPSAAPTPVAAAGTATATPTAAGTGTLKVCTIMFNFSGDEATLSAKGPVTKSARVELPDLAEAASKRCVEWTVPAGRYRVDQTDDGIGCGLDTVEIARGEDVETVGDGGQGGAEEFRPFAATVENKTTTTVSISGQCDA